MKRFIVTTGIFFIAIILSCCGDTKQDRSSDEIAGNGEIEILQSWQGDYPLNQLNLLPEEQRNLAVGYINDGGIFENVWNAFMPGKEIPVVDFSTYLVLFTRNTQFYNRISIGKVNLTNGVAEVLAMETMSAIPIEDKVAFAAVLIARQGISAIKSGESKILID